VTANRPRRPPLTFVVVPGLCRRRGQGAAKAGRPWPRSGIIRLIAVPLTGASPAASLVNKISNPARPPLGVLPHQPMVISRLRGPRPGTAAGPGPRPASLRLWCINGRHKTGKVLVHPGGHHRSRRVVVSIIRRPVPLRLPEPGQPYLFPPAAPQYGGFLNRGECPAPLAADWSRSRAQTASSSALVPGFSQPAAEKNG
jgi:hypothetical protein